jgi:hypothetical protein
VAEVGLVLGVSDDHAESIVVAFQDFVAAPLASNLAKQRGHDLAKRNPMIYTVRGVTRVDEWIDRVLADKETSAIEAQLGTWQEEVARIVSGGIKPGNGVDLQVDGSDGVVRLYAIQTSPNTKNSGGRKADINSLKAAAKVLWASKRKVEMYIAVLHGRNKTGAVTNEQITVLASDEFWQRISGVADFRARLLRSCKALTELMEVEAGDELNRIRSEALAVFDDGSGQLDLNALANPQKSARFRDSRGRQLDIEFLQS